MSGAKDFAAEWLGKAEEDVLTMKILLESGRDFPASSVCFHAQQAVEKFLKSFLAFSEKDFKPVHDVFYLLELCITLIRSFKI